MLFQNSLLRVFMKKFSPLGGVSLATATSIVAGIEERIMAVGIKGVPTTTVRQFGEKGPLGNIFQSLNLEFVLAHFGVFIIVQTAVYRGYSMECKHISRIKVTLEIG